MKRLTGYSLFLKRLDAGRSGTVLFASERERERERERESSDEVAVAAYILTSYVVSQ